EFCNFADTILNLCAAFAVCSSHIATWQTLLQRQMWLQLSSSIPEDFKRELQEGPISPDRLLGPHFQSVLGQMQTYQEELERVRRHPASVPPIPPAAGGIAVISGISRGVPKPLLRLP
ncbi:hypothetical protein ILYODFUR_035001, partial [Ilyodon furcidens]